MAQGSMDQEWRQLQIRIENMLTNSNYLRSNLRRIEGKSQEIVQLSEASAGYSQKMMESQQDTG
jgi:hypothetical protein